MPHVQPLLCISSYRLKSLQVLHSGKGLLRPDATFVYQTGTFLTVAEIYSI